MIALRPLPFPLDTPLRGLPFAAVDFEATGFAGPEAHVVEVAVAHGTIGLPTVVPAFSSLVRPGVPIPDAASRVHGIFDEHVVDAPRWPDVEERLAAACEGRLVVAWSVPADVAFWMTEAARHGTPAPTWPWLCLLAVRAASVSRGRPGRLAEVAAAHSIALDAHGAAGDALTTAMLLSPLMTAAWRNGVFREYGGLRAAEDRYYAHRRGERDEDDLEPLDPPRTLGGLLAWQRGTTLYQERNWSSYRRSQGDAVAPACPWHALWEEVAPSWGTKARARPCPACGASVVDRVEASGQRQVVDPATAEPHVCRS